MEDLKLSDYMERGLKLTRPLKHHYLEHEGSVIRACPIGAACYAKDPESEVSDPDVGSMAAFDTFPQLSGIVYWRGSDGKQAPVETTLINLVTSLNDVGGWRRDRILRLVKHLGY